MGVSSGDIDAPGRQCDKCRPRELDHNDAGPSRPDRRIQMTTDPAVIDIDEMPRAGIASWLERRLQARGPQDRDVGDLVNWPDRRGVDEILARTGMLHGVERDAVAALTKQLQPIDFPRGHTVFAEGEPGDRLYIIVSGKG